MIERTHLHSAIRLCVWTASAAGALWLAMGESTMADAVAHVVAPEHRIAALEGGRIREILVQPGQKVRQGQLLARLDTALIEREIAAAEAKLRETRSGRLAAEAELETSGDQVERAFHGDIDAVAAQEDAARIQQRREQQELQTLRAEATRLRTLVRQGLAKADRVDDIELRARTLESQMLEWPARLKAAEERRRNAEKRLEEWRSQHKVQTARQARDAQTAPFANRLEEQTEMLRLLRTRLEHARLTAPADGEVVSVLARPGDVARAGEPFLILNGAQAVQVLAYLREKEGDWLKPGDRAVLRRRTMSRQEVQSRVVRVADHVTQLPVRFWLTPTAPVWGREVLLELPRELTDRGDLDAGEAFDARFFRAAIGDAPKARTTETASVAAAVAAGGAR